MKEVDVQKRFEDYKRHTLDAITKLSISADSFGLAVEKISACEGKVITTGLGKAGHVANKASSSFCSLGIPSCFLHPAEASHGDSGILCKQDVVLAFSTSGKTREVIETLRFARNRVQSVICVTSHADATIRKFADVTIDMGDIKEAGYLSIAPTTSILIMLILADLLATCAAEAKEFSIADFSKYHHGGYLGAKARGGDTSSSSY